jgi:hypothetical protein
VGSLWAFTAACGGADTQPELIQPVPSPALVDAAQAPAEAGQAPQPGPDLSAPMDAGRTDAGVSPIDAMSATRDGSTGAPAVDAGSGDAGVADAMPSASDGSVADADASGSTATQDASTDSAISAQEAGADAGAARVVTVDSKAEWTPSGFQVEAGKCYAVSAKIDDRWLDADVPADLNGWVDQKDARLALFEPFRRVATKELRFYQFGACVNRDLAQCFAVGTSTTLCPKTSGELVFFVNDVPGFESNNVGTATVTLQAK